MDLKEKAVLAVDALEKEYPMPSARWSMTPKRRMNC